MRIDKATSNRNHQRYSESSRGLKALRALAGIAIVVICAMPSSASAASPWSGTIGRIDMRTGWGDTYLTTNLSHDLVIRSSSGSAVCSIAHGTAHFQDFLSVAMAAMLAGLNVTLERHGNADGLFKCAQISVTR
jgi:hypothetical protein